MASDYWYKWYPAKFKAETMDLSHERKSMYRDIIDHYMETGKPIPDKDGVLAAIARIPLDQWMTHAASIRPFFEARDGMLYLKRCELLIGGFKATKVKNSDNGQLGGLRKAEKTKNKPAVKQPSENNNTSSGRQTPDVAEKKRKDESRGEKSLVIKSNGELSKLEADNFFQQFWLIYPGHGSHGARGIAYKGSRKKAFEKFYSLLKGQKDYDQFTDDLIDAAGRYEEFLNSESWRASQHAITWLNQEQWNTDYTIRESGRGSGSSSDAIAQGFGRALRDDGE